jgi:ceramide glucosyltransferase
MALILALLGMMVLVAVLGTHATLRRYAPEGGLPARALPRYPSVTMIRPIRGLDVDAEDNLRATLDNDYPGQLDTIFVLDDESDPALPLVRRIAEEFPDRARVLIAGPPRPGMTGKLNAMSLGAREARGELIGFGDSDTRPKRDLVRRLVETLMHTPGAGDVFAPVVVEDDAVTAGDVAHALLFDAWYGPSVALVASRSGRHVPFIMGQLMIFKREALRAIGGVECAAGQLTDDMYIGQCVERAGFRNVMADARLPIHARGMSVLNFARMMRRWILFSRNGLPLEFTLPQWLRPIEFWAALSLTALAFYIGAPVAAAPSILALLAAGENQLDLARSFGGPVVRFRHLWVPFAILLSAPLALFVLLGDRTVDWRGREYVLEARASLRR